MLSANFLRENISLLSFPSAYSVVFSQTLNSKFSAKGILLVLSTPGLQTPNSSVSTGNNSPPTGALVWKSPEEVTSQSLLCNTRGEQSHWDTSFSVNQMFDPKGYKPRLKEEF